MSIVHIFKISNPADIYFALKAVSPSITKDTVLIKPNIVMAAKSNSGVVTDVKMVEGIIRYLKEKRVKRIVIAESVGLGMDVSEAFKVSGYSRLSKKEQIELIDLEKVETIEKPWKFGTIKIPKLVLDSYYINVPKLKTHTQTIVTLGIKNQKGILKSEDRKRFHILWGLDEPLAELLRVVKPNLTIVDGIIGIEGDGPAFLGKKIKTCVTIIGDDVVAVDATCCRIMSIEPSSVPHIFNAFKRSMGNIAPSTEGIPIEEVRRKFALPNTEYFKMMKLFSIRSKWACSMCSDSLRGALKMTFHSPSLFIKYMPRWIYLILFKGVKFIAGTHASVNNNQGKVICLGDCMGSFAQQHNLCFVRGCPPAPNEILKSI